ncbi:hypothetical protein QR680_005360 [Steinernema hermaphroditum]|uniref:Uncharacterized protein n=1 Tax=Steinernema hermaphroditum TaxID=289476 RepID=A0AA39HSX9_9BILA|nr:hypothetical protein QR680_005360 [Steinernema hermaphroditum]
MDSVRGRPAVRDGLLAPVSGGLPATHLAPIGLISARDVYVSQRSCAALKPRRFFSRLPIVFVFPLDPRGVFCFRRHFRHMSFSVSRH